MTYLLSVGVSAWNLHAHRYYRVARQRPMRSWSVGPIRAVVTSYLVSPVDELADDGRRVH